MTLKRSETEIAAPITAHLQEYGWEVHHEVQIYSGGRRADIVALQGRLVHIIESKVSLGLDVIEQAIRWIGEAHYVSVAVGRHRGGFVDQVLRSYGIGGYVVSPFNSIDQFVRPRLFRRATCNIRKGCSVETRAGENVPAGSAGGGYFTPFKRTVRSIQDTLRIRGELTTKELITEIQHHYHNDSTAKSCLVNWARAGKIPGVELTDGRPLRWRLVTQTSQVANG